MKFLKLLLGLAHYEYKFVVYEPNNIVGSLSAFTNKLTREGWHLQSHSGNGETMHLTFRRIV